MKKHLLFSLFLLISALSHPVVSKDKMPPPPPQEAPNQPAPAEEAKSVVAPPPFIGDDLLNSEEKPSYEGAFLKMILTLGGLLALVFFTLWVLRKLSHGRMGTFGSQKKIKILEKRPLSPKTVLYLVQLDGKEVFISESQFEVRTLLTVHEEEDFN